MSERGTLMAVRCCMGGEQEGLEEVAREGTNLDGAVFEEHATGEHDLLVCTRDVEIPTATTI